ncbi:MAG: metallophosphoesterase family protein [Myxococcota bacterium]|nr:metallophosphoesterase family protein [Myxococcota bacterium]
MLASGAKVMVCGHTHRPYVRRVDDLLIVNGGTLYRAHQPGFVSVDLEAGLAVRG